MKPVLTAGLIGICLSILSPFINVQSYPNPVFSNTPAVIALDICRDSGVVLPNADTPFIQEYPYSPLHINFLMLEESNSCFLNFFLILLEAEHPPETQLFPTIHSY